MRQEVKGYDPLSITVINITTSLRSAAMGNHTLTPYSDENRASLKPTSHGQSFDSDIAICGFP